MSERFDQLFDDRVYRELKNSLFSYLLRRRLITGILRGEESGLALDLGSGISPVAPATGSTVFSDMSPVAMRLLRSEEAGAHYVALDANVLPFQDESFSLVVCSEVIEHVARDEQVLCEIHRVMQPGGRLILTAPVHSYYYTFDDEYVGHYRRYELPKLAEMLNRTMFVEVRTRKVAGLLEKVATYAMARSFALLDRRWAQGRAGRRWWFGPYRAVNYTWSYLCAWEGRISPWMLTSIVLVDCRRA